ncbi:MAG: DNA polymerase Y family protein, partial [Burkholderiaceae bacterium]|nr:DNA polymerase Y family protein [Microbacteriaceae bacterium]
LVDDRGALSGTPCGLSMGGTARAITAWAGPWPLDERWWDADDRARGNRFQVVDDTGLAWLLMLDGTSWWAEARYD